MCSAPGPTQRPPTAEADAVSAGVEAGRADDGSGGRAGLIVAAMALVAEQGPRAATVRAVAERAGVSAPLVMHHFGSKDGLIAACDEHVRELVEHAMHTIGEDMTSEANLQALLAVPDVAVALGYVARSLAEGGAIGRWWFDEMMQLTLDGLATAEAAGTVRGSDDPEMRAILLLSMDLGVLLMRPLVERRLGASLTDERVVERWVRTEFDLLTRGVVARSDDDATALATRGRSDREVAG